jgi:hypothetical protein
MQTVLTNKVLNYKRIPTQKRVNNMFVIILTNRYCISTFWQHCINYKHILTWKIFLKKSLEMDANGCRRRFFFTWKLGRRRFKTRRRLESNFWLFCKPKTKKRFRNINSRSLPFAGFRCALKVFYLFSNDLSVLED